MLSLVSW